MTIPLLRSLDFDMWLVTSTRHFADNLSLARGSAFKELVTAVYVVAIYDETRYV